jgi:hypothetical protein
VAHQTEPNDRPKFYVLTAVVSHTVSCSPPLSDGEDASELLERAGPKALDYVRKHFFSTLLSAMPPSVKVYSNSDSFFASISIRLANCDETSTGFSGIVIALLKLSQDVDKPPAMTICIGIGQGENSQRIPVYSDSNPYNVSGARASNINLSTILEKYGAVKMSIMGRKRKGELA